MNDEAAVSTLLVDYYRAFSTLEVQAVIPYFHEPSLFIGPQGVFAAPAHATLAAVFTPAMEDLRARGYGRSELSVQQLKLLSATSALAAGVAIRYKAGGQELDRAGVTYVLHKADTGWRIAVIVLYDADRGAAGQ